MADLKDWLNSINLTKEDITREDPQLIKKYAPFIINKCMSAHLDCIMFANEMNLQSHLAKDLQYQFYLNSIRKKKRFSPWLRNCLLYTSPSPRDRTRSRMPSSA